MNKHTAANPRNRIYESRGEPFFQAGLVIFFVLLSVTFLYTYWHVAATSFTSPDYASASGFKLWPRQWSWDAYIHMFNASFLWSGYFNTIKVVLLGWSCSLTGVILGAYPLSKRDLVCVPTLQP